MLDCIIVSVVVASSNYGTKNLSSDFGNVTDAKFIDFSGLNVVASAVNKS